MKQLGKLLLILSFLGLAACGGGDKAPSSSAASQAPLEITDEMIAEGKIIFQTNCSFCHNVDGSAGAGPDLFDNAWLNGDGTHGSIQTIISNGVDGTIMPKWSDYLSQQEIIDVAAYVYTL